MRHKARIPLKTGEKPRDSWQTPPDLFKNIDNVFHFTIDGAASDSNTLCEHFFSEGNTFLTSTPEDQKIFVNPPFSELSNGEWTAKAAELGKKNIVVMLLPAAVETRYWHDSIWKDATEILFFKKRIQYYERGKKGGSPTFASALIGFGTKEFSELSYLGAVVKLKETV